MAVKYVADEQQHYEYTCRKENQLFSSSRKIVRLTDLNDIQCINGDLYAPE
jgi:hypothetical protein